MQSIENIKFIGKSNLARKLYYKWLAVTRFDPVTLVSSHALGA
jgi:hypothetical protein